MQINLPGVRVSRFEVGSGERVRDHSHPDLHIFCLLAGDMEQAVDGSSRRLSKGGVRLSPARSSHSIDFAGSGAECLVLHLSDPRLLTSIRGQGSEFMDDPGLRPVFMRLAEEARLGQPAMWLTIRELVTRVRALSAIPDPKAPPEWLVEAREGLLDWNGGASPWGAQDAGVSSEHLIRSFRRYFGATPGDFRRIAMLGQALKLLETSEVSLVEAALDAGFAHQSHMTNLMRRTLGVTPGAWRAASGARISSMQDASAEVS